MMKFTWKYSLWLYYRQQVLYKLIISHWCYHLILMTIKTFLMRLFHPLPAQLWLSFNVRLDHINLSNCFFSFFSVQAFLALTKQVIIQVLQTKVSVRNTQYNTIYNVYTCWEVAWQAWLIELLSGYIRPAVVTVQNI